MKITVNPNTILGRAVAGRKVLAVTSGLFTGLTPAKNSNLYKCIVWAGLNPDDYGKTFKIVYGAKKRYRSQGREMAIVAIED